MPKRPVDRLKEKRDTLYELQDLLCGVLGEGEALRLVGEAHKRADQKRRGIFSGSTQDMGGGKTEPAEPEIAYKTETYRVGKSEVEVRRKAGGELVEVKLNPYHSISSSQVRILKLLVDKGVLPELR